MVLGEEDAGRVVVDLDDDLVGARRGLQVVLEMPAAVAVGVVQPPQAGGGLVADLRDLHTCPITGRAEPHRRWPNGRTLVPPLRTDGGDSSSMASLQSTPQT